MKGRNKKKIDWRDFWWIILLLTGFGHEFLAKSSRVVVFNSGASFGLMVNKWLVLVFWLFFCWWLEDKRFLGWYLLVVGGGVNLVDRIRLGWVRDYWKLPFFSVYNNIGDWLIFLGLVIILWESWRTKSK